MIHTTVETVGLFAGACAFCAITGANDGGTLVAVGRSVRGLTPITAVGLLAAGSVVTPLIVGTGVATTFTDRLVVFAAGSGRSVLILAVLAAVCVVLVLSVRGLPTSITLALIGGIAGAGLGSGTGVSWPTVAFVLLFAALAPLVGAVLAVILSWCAGRVPVPEGVHHRVRWLHIVAFLALCLAYGANDGQKMLAVFAIGTGLTAAGVAASLPVAVAIAACFAAGAAWGFDRQARGGLEMVPGRPTQSVTAELSSALAVLGASVLVAPVSMTQSVAGSLVGAGATHFRRRIRWRLVLRVAAAWALTLPSAGALGACLAAVAGAVT